MCMCVCGCVRVCVYVCVWHSEGMYMMGFGDGMRVSLSRLHVLLQTRHESQRFVTLYATI